MARKVRVEYSEAGVQEMNCKVVADGKNKSI